MYRQEEIKPYSEEGSKREQVEQMFDNIAHSYDTLNHTLSLGIDKLWRRRAIGAVPTSASLILDVATGTGDLALLASRKIPSARIIGADISQEMMDIGQKKVAASGLSDRIAFQYEDCAALSFPDDTFDAVVSAFALRNFADLSRCLSEMHRVLKPGGTLSIIDLCTPSGFPMKQLFSLYKHLIMPTMGRLISHDDLAYTYLPATMDAIPQAEDMTAIIRQAGFAAPRYKRLPFGMCIHYTATKT